MLQLRHYYIIQTLFQVQCNHRVQSKYCSPPQHFENTHFSCDHIFHLFYLLLQFTEKPLLTFSQTIIQVSTEITKIIHHMNRTKHAHCSTTVLSTWQLTRAFTHFMQKYLHVLQNRLLKFKKCLFLFVFLHFTVSLR